MPNHAMQIVKPILFFVLGLACFFGIGIASRGGPLLGPALMTIALGWLNARFSGGAETMLAELGLLRWEKFWTGALIGLALVLMLWGQQWAAGLLGIMETAELTEAQFDTGGDFTVWAVLGTLLTVSWEELWLRGYPLTSLRRSYGPRIAICATSASFAALHLLNPELPWYALPHLFAAGVFLATLVMRGGLPMAIGAHLIWNLAGSDGLRGALGLGVLEPHPVFGDTGIAATVALLLAAWLLRPRSDGTHDGATALPDSDRGNG